MEKLKSCPCCEGTAMLVSDMDGTFCVICKKCHMMIAHFNTKAKAIAAWNNRPNTGECNWKYDDIYEFWETSCSHAFCIMEGNPADNRMKYCPYCGKFLKELPIPEVK